jgi:hypothetical protein
MTNGSLAETTALLERTPRVVHSPLDGLPDTWLETPDTPDGWTPNPAAARWTNCRRSPGPSAATLGGWAPIHPPDPERNMQPSDITTTLARRRDLDLP